MSSNGRLRLVVVLASMLSAPACLDSGHLLGQARGTGGAAGAMSNGTGGAVMPDGAGGARGAGGAPVACPAGAPACACRADGSCNAGLRCTSGLCVTDGSGGGGASNIGTGGGSSSGGRAGSGGMVGSGGVSSGGTTGGGGVAGTGGAAGAGAAPAAGGAGGTASANLACGGPAGGTCPAGQFCDLASRCGTISDASGVCMPFGWDVTCSDVATPVCGCEDKTYVNDCQRAAAGMLKAMDGVCPDNGFTYPTAYLAWQTSAGVAGRGPAAAVNAPDWLITWDDTGSFPPESPPANPTAMHGLTITDTDDLFLRLAGVNVGALPHAPPATSDCQSTLYFRLCKGCAPNTLTYGSAAQVAPEMELIWSWFDRQIGATALTNPRNYCSP